MEYYSDIKRNTFGSILMRWMKLEPIIQSEVSQKEKKIYVKAYIWKPEDGTDEFICRTAMEKKTKKRPMETGREGRRERVRYMERVTWKLTLPYVK